MSLQKDFAKIKRLYFPKWDKRNEWHIKFDNSLPCSGQCDTESKLIKVCQRSERQLLIAHEICHCFATGHGKTWQARFIKVADKAESLGNTELARTIRAEVESYRSDKCPKLTRQVVYDEIRDAVMDAPEADFKNIMKFVANTWGLKPDELLMRYKNLQTVYDKAKRDYQDEQDRRIKYGLT